MILLNFSHPLHDVHLAALRALIQSDTLSVQNIPVQFDPVAPFVPQAEALVEACGLTATEWQNMPLLLNLPSLNYITAILLAEIHGRVGHFPPIVRLRQNHDVIPPRWEVEELIGLQKVRERARQRR